MPTAKRARQKAARQARMEALRKAQQRRKSYRRGGIVGGIVVIAIVLAIVTTTTGGGGSVKTVTPLTTAKLDAALTAHAAPPLSANCSSAGTASTSTTTVPAKGHAVSIVPAPAGIGFPNLNGSSKRYTSFTSAPPFCIDVSKTYTAKVKTDLGTITVELLPKYAPQTVNNFVFLAGYHYFDGTVFHRVVKGFVDQGGDPTATGSGGPGYMFDDELPAAVTAYDDGALAMANSGANTNGSQFFFVVGTGGKQLTAAYSMFGQVTNGLSVIKKINNDGSVASSGTPTTIHKIISVSITVS